MRTLVLAVLWIATVAGAYLLGGGGGGAPSSEVEPVPAAVRPEAAQLRGHEGSPLRGEDAGAAAETTTGDVAARASVPSGGPSDEPLPSFTLEGVSTPDEAFDRLMAHVSALLARGEAGHLELLAFLDQHIVRNKSIEALFGSEQEAARFIYPMVKFLVDRDQQVLGVTETVFKTMAADPQAFADFDDDTLEVFTEGVAFILPGAVDEARMARFRSYASTILETPESEQPEAVSKNRRRIERVLGFWAPRLEPEQALQRLQSGEATSQEVLALLKSLPADMRAQLDMGLLLAPIVASGDYRAIRMLGQVGVTSRDLTLLDRAAIEGMVAGKFNEWTLQQYLNGTGRGKWPAGQGLVEAALAEGDPARATAAMSLRRLGPPKDYVTWVLESYDLNEATRKRLAASFGLAR